MMLNFLFTSFIAVGSICLMKRLVTWYKIHRKIKKKQHDVSSRKTGLYQKFQGLKIPFQNRSRICHLSGSEIHKLIKSGELSAIDVLEAFQANAIIENDRFNFLVDIIYEADVSSLMVDLDRNDEIMGFPLAISDSLSVAKYDSTFGLLGQVFRPSIKDSTIIEVLIESGAIPAIITNVGQGDLSMTTSNPIFGQTLNSSNIKRKLGGSSGGLAVAIATGSCLIGVTNDIHGNTRIPASFCGVFGLKTSSGRVSRRHVKTVIPAQSIIADSIGVMARNIDDLVATVRAMLSKRMFELDPLCPPLPFDESVYANKSPLRIGYYVGLGGDRLLKPVPAVERAVMLAKRALEQAGHVVVEYQLPGVDRLADKLYTRIMLSDGGESVKRTLYHEPTDRSMRSYLWLLKLPRMVKQLMAIVSGVFCDTGAKWLSGVAGVSSVFEAWSVKESVTQYREEVLVSWQDDKLDGLICPVLPVVAPPVNSSDCMLRDNAYVVAYNILDYAAGSVPVTIVTDEDIDDMERSYASRSRCCRRIADSQRDSVGLPVGVQCVALPWREEVALRMMKDIADHV